MLETKLFLFCYQQESGRDDQHSAEGQRRERLPVGQFRKRSSGDRRRSRARTSGSI